MKLRDLLPKDILNEVSTQEYSYGCAMLYFDFPEMANIHGIIKKEDIYTENEDKSFGLEDEPHCTLLYGLHKEITKNEITPIIENFSYGNCELQNASLFENEKYDVLKFDVSGKNLAETNEKLKELPYTSDFPDFHPHMTIAYLKPGMGKKYVNRLENVKYAVAPKNIIFSPANGEKTEISINISEGSAEYYQNNPEARKKKQAYDKKLNSDPKQVKKRVESNAARRKATKAGKNIKGKDASHTKNGIRFKESSKNRGSKSDTKGDKNARGGGKRKTK